MSVVNDIVGKIFGNKSDRDLRDVTPVITKIKEAYELVVPFTNDELRNSSAELKIYVGEQLKETDLKITEMKERSESDEVSVLEKEKLYQSIDKLEKELDEKLEIVLNEILPKAFAIIKETARRFKENESLEVTANDNDRNLAAQKDFVEIKGDKAIYHNSWMAGGNKIVWDMVHYDVQLIGGVMLHEGKIAEMATGEKNKKLVYSVYRLS